MTEKTPFNVPANANDDWNNNMCKSWESNVDATFEGNGHECDGYNNWGGCGFQRHFAWGQQVGIDTFHSKIEMDNTSTGAAVYNGLANPSADITRTFGSADDTKFKVGGVPFLGGICKLFIPVLAEHIEQVTVSGVHVNGRAQFPAQVTSNEGGGDETVTPGTAYCFSVVNIAEFKTNANGDIANANVAGSAAQLLAGNTYTGAADIFDGATSLQRQAGRDIGDFGDAASAFTTIDQTEMVEGGANFDVVAHFNYDYCQNFWNPVDMQLAGDVNSGGTIDYPLDPENNFSHAHEDLQDKRHGTVPIAVGSGYLDIGGGYLTGNVRWPNFGAWAGYNSFVACANADSGNDPTTLPDEHWLRMTDDRIAVMSVGSADFRSKLDGTDCANDEWAEYQFNVRQVGKDVVVCGPGELPDTDNKRCTWNWNYDASNDNRFGASSSADAEGFFDRNENLDFSVWSRKRRADVTRDDTVGTQPVNAQAALSEPLLTFTFVNYKNNAVTPTLTQLSGEASATNGFLISGQTVTIKCDNNAFIPGSSNQRDLFPTCFVGDEIHLKATYTPDTTNDNNRAFISPWLSSVEMTFP